VERTRGDEQDVVGLDHPVLGIDGRALDGLKIRAARLLLLSIQQPL
jgi:hypothetical protein